MTSVTDALVEFVTGTSTADIPSPVRANAVDTIVDIMGTTWAGLSEHSPTVIRNAALPVAAAGPARVAGVSERVDAGTAALCNAAAAHALDYDVISFAVSGFVGSATLFALSAVAEERGFAADDVVSAYCLGWEAAAVLGRGLNPEHYDLGWHPTATMSLIAATMGLCRVAGLDAERTANALSIAVSEASGIKIMIGNDLNAYHVGKAARNSITALRLAEAGFDGNRQSLDAEQGFLALFSGPSGPDLPAALDSVGSTWDLLDPGPVWKVHACCGLIHSGLDAVAEIRAREQLSPDDVLKVEVLVHSYVPRVMHVKHPRTGYAAKFCIPYCVAAAVRDGSAGLGAFDGVDPALVEIGERVTVGVHPELQGGDTFFATEFTDVRLTTRRGVFEQRVHRLENRGTGSIPSETLREKFVDGVSREDTLAGIADKEFERLRAIDTGEEWQLWPN